MPRGQKSKLRAREKRRQAQGEPQGLVGTQSTAAKVEESPDSPVSGDTPPSFRAAGTSQEPQGSPATSSPAAGVSRRKSNVGAKGQVEKNKNSSRASTSSESARQDLLTRKVGMLMQFLLEKHTMRAPIRRADMLKLVNKRYREHFPEILRRASEHMELVFGLELKEVKPGSCSYILISMADFPKNGLLMPLLGVIFLTGNRASEEDIWEFLNILGIYDGRRHLVFGDPRKLITQDLVQENDPPRYEFLWGPRARAEISKMRVLEFLAKVHDTIPSAFPFHYEEALRDEEERVGLERP
uniref:Melanoma-associated antigen B1 n=1 Tax=Ailuropoda melanoleuca TaxID=9646 RepID=A0A7N5JJG4_AILME